MQIATIINVHNQPEMARDVIDSVRAWVTKKIILLVDGASWPLFANFRHSDTHVLKGFVHAARRSPYKNWILGMLKAYEQWPEVDWYNYIEYDALYLNSNFKIDLQARQNEGFVFVGFNHYIKQDSNDHWLVREIIGEKSQGLTCHKILGAVTFVSKFAIEQLNDFGFFREVLERTKDFQRDYFPTFGDYAVEEILFPSAASVLGKVGNLSPTNSSSPRYAVRFAPEVTREDIQTETSIIHPLKKHDDVIHTHYRQHRKIFLTDDSF